MSIFQGYLEGGEDYYTYYNCDNNHTRQNTPHYRDEVNDRKTSKGSKKDPPHWGKWCGYDLWDGDRPVTDANGTYSTHLYTDRAQHIIKKAAASEKVFT